MKHKPCDVLTLNGILFLYEVKALGSELYAVNTNYQKVFLLQGIMGRPGPMGQVGTKGEKVSCITTEAHFFILKAAGLLTAFVLNR